MTKRQKLLMFGLISTVVVAYVLAFLGCSIMSFDVAKCVGPLQSLDFIIYAPAGVLFAAFSLFQFYKKPEPRKTHPTATSIIILVTAMASLVISVVTVSYHIPIFFLTLIGIWLSLSTIGRLWWALVGWSLFATLLICVMVFIYPDHSVVVSFLYALISGGAMLYKTGAHKLAERSGYAVAASIPVLIFIMGCVAVVEWGMPPEGYEVLILAEGIERATPYVDGVLVVAGGFFGLAPFMCMLVKDSQGPRRRPLA